MYEYDLGFATKLAQTAALLDEREPYSCDARRVMIYLSRLSMEVALKALLERAGKKVSEIRSRSHDLNALLNDLDSCQVLYSTEGEDEWVSAASVRGIMIDLGLVKLPIGDFIASTHPNLSKYPNQIRYGSTVVDFQPTFLVDSAVQLCVWANKHVKTIRLAKSAA